ncbi:MAG: tetratricopeptide repeat protein [Aggregatilineales bacterium]
MLSFFRRIQRVGQWLGPARAQWLFALLALTGLLSLVLNAVNGTSKTPVAWVVPAQTALLLLFAIGAFGIVLSRLHPNDRRRALIIIAPALLALVLAFLFPGLWLLFLPAGFGWIFVAYIASQSRVRREYQAAIKHLRKNEYDQAIEVMSALIKTEPEVADHRRFRAELYRLSGKGYRARADYEKVIQLTPESGVGYNGLAEVYLQDGEYEAALDYAQKAYELEPDDWVAPYNLGMIEDRLNRAPDAITHLTQSLSTGIPDSRHRLLTHLWLARAHVRLEDTPNAETELAMLKRERTGLNEWQIIFESDQSAVLRAVLQADVTLAGQLIEGEATLDTLQQAKATEHGA